MTVSNLLSTNVAVSVIGIDTNTEQADYTYSPLYTKSKKKKSQMVPSLIAGQVHVLSCLIAVFQYNFSNFHLLFYVHVYVHVHVHACRVVKASSPWLNVILLIGVIIRLPSTLLSRLVLSSHEYGFDISICHVSQCACTCTCTNNA